MGFWDEFVAPEPNDIQVKPPRVERRIQRLKRAEAILARIPPRPPRPCASPGCPLEADLLTHCVACDVADGYLEAPTS